MLQHQCLNQHIKVNFAQRLSHFHNLRQIIFPTQSENSRKAELKIKQ